MPRKANLELIDGTIIASDKVIGNRKFPNNEINHQGQMYEILKLKRPDLAPEDNSDIIVRYIVKQKS